MKKELPIDKNDSEKLRKIFFLIVALIIFLLSLSYRLLAQDNILLAQDNILYSEEIENLSYNNLELLEDSAASNMQFLRMPDSGFVSFTLNVPQNGYYNITIGYRAFGGSKEEYLEINNRQIAIGFAYSEDWNNFDQKIYLTEGQNSIKLEDSWGNIDFDKISISTTSIIPKIKPLRNSFYKDNPRDITYIVDNYKNQLISVKCEERDINYELKPYLFKDESVILVVNKNDLLTLKNGSSTIEIEFSDSSIIKTELQIKEKLINYDMTIISPYVEHGTAIIFILPNKDVLLIDSGKDWVRDSILIPLLNNYGIEVIDHFIITHYDGDHDSGDRGEKIKEVFSVKNFYDYKSFKSGDEFKIGKVNFKVLNSFGDGTDENTNSLSFNMEYNGFIYQHGGDTYALNQEKMLQKFPDNIKCDVFYANHHFHGSVNPKYIISSNPKLVIIQAQEAIYARSAYMEKFKKVAEKFLLSKSENYVESLPTLEVGAVVVRVNNKEEWVYETYSGAPIVK